MRCGHEGKTLATADCKGERAGVCGIRSEGGVDPDVDESRTLTAAENPRSSRQVREKGPEAGVG